MSLYTDSVPFTPETGKSYLNLNGTTYRCVAGLEDGDTYATNCAWMVSPAGWAFKAMYCMKYPDGCIDWGQSLYGHFINDGNTQFQGGYT